jgi:hypothetical protein
MRPQRLLPALLLLAASCGSAEAGVDAADRARFVEVNVALRAAGGMQDSIPRDSLLEAHGVSQEWLIALSGQLARDPRGVADVWDEIYRRLNPQPVLTENLSVPADPASPADTGDVAEASTGEGEARLPVEGPPPLAAPRPTRGEGDRLPSVRRGETAPAARGRVPRESPPPIREVAPPQLPPQRPEEGLTREPQ